MLAVPDIVHNGGEAKAALSEASCDIIASNRKQL